MCSDFLYKYIYCGYSFNCLGKSIKAYVVGTNLNRFKHSSKYQKQNVVGTHLNRLELSKLSRQEYQQHTLLDRIR